MSQGYVTISHDAFGRFEVVRRVLEDSHQECAWCGQRARFEYGTLQDGVSTKPNWRGKAFCSIGCYRVYDGN